MYVLKAIAAAKKERIETATPSKKMSPSFFGVFAFFMQFDMNGGAFPFLRTQNAFSFLLGYLKVDLEPGCITLRVLG